MPEIIRLPDGSNAADFESRRNSLVKECLHNRPKREVLNQSMADSVANAVYDLSLARVLLEPQPLHNGQLDRPVVSERGPVVKVWFREESDRVVMKNAYRDSVEEEERTTVRRRLMFLPMGSDRTAIDAFTFQISNVAKFKSLNLNGSAGMLVDRARQRMARAMGHDETRIVLDCVLWAASRFGRQVWSWFSPARAVAAELTRLAATYHNPVVLLNPLDLLTINFDPNVMFSPTADNAPTTAIGLVAVGDRRFPVYADPAIPDGQVLVMPAGHQLGALVIASHPVIASNDKQDRFLVGWTCAEEVGIVLSNLRDVTTINLGTAGFVRRLRMFIGRPGAERVAKADER